MRDLMFDNDGQAVHEGPCAVAIAFDDVVRFIGVTDQVTVNEERAGDGAVLENRVDGEYDAVRKLGASKNYNCSFMIKDPNTPENLIWFTGGGSAPPANETRYRLRKLAQGQRIYESQKLRAAFKEGLVQVHDSTVFPAPTALNLADSGAGTLADDDYFAWVVHVYANTFSLNELDKVVDADFILANLANYDRSVHYVCGIPSASDTVAASGGSNALTLSWSVGVIPAGMPYPTHSFVVLGTVDDINDAGSHVAAIVPFATTNVTLTANGSIDFGTDPDLEDCHLHQLQALSGDARSPGALVENTNYTFNVETGETQRVTGINSGAEIVRHLWYIMPPSMDTEGPSSGNAEVYATLMFLNLQSDETDPDTRRPSGQALYAWKVNLADASGVLMQGIREGFHDGKQVSGLRMLRHPDHNRQYKLVTFSERLDNFVDYYSVDKTAA